MACMREGADVERVSSLSRRAPLLLAMHERALPPMRSRELVRRIWEHGQPVLWAKIGIAAEPLIDARRVEDVGARQAARAVSYLEVFEADGARLVDESIRRRRGRVRGHMPTRGACLEARARDRLGFGGAVEVSKCLVVLGSDVAVLQFHQQVIRGKIYTHARRGCFSFRSELRHADHLRRPPYLRHYLWEVGRAAGTIRLGGARRRERDDFSV